MKNPRHRIFTYFLIMFRKPKTLFQGPSKKKSGWGLDKSFSKQSPLSRLSKCLADMECSKYCQHSFSSLLWVQWPFSSMRSHSFSIVLAMNALTLPQIFGNRVIKLNFVNSTPSTEEDNMRLEFSGVSTIRTKTAFTIWLINLTFIVSQTTKLGFSDPASSVAW